MDFKEFAHRMAENLGNGNNTAEFTKTLFEAIVREDVMEILDNTSQNTFKAYYNGQTGISKLSKKIVKNIEPESFVEFIDSFQDAVIESLCISFSSVCPGINNWNASKVLSELFANIIKEAAGSVRKSPKSAFDDVVIPTPIISDDCSATSNECYSDSDRILLQEFHVDYDELIIASVNMGEMSGWLNGNTSKKVDSLYNDKWKTKAEQFDDPMIKSYVFALFGKLRELSDTLNPLKDYTSPTSVRILKQNISNLYVKLHPDDYSETVPYDLFYDEWDAGEYY